MQTFLTRIPVLFLCVYHKRNPQASSPNIGSQALPAALICNNGFYDCILSKILSLLIPRASKLFPITFYIFAFSTLNAYTDNLTFLPAFTALIPAADNVINVLASSWTGWSWFVGLFWLLLLFSHTEILVWKWQFQRGVVFRLHGRWERCRRCHLVSGGMLGLLFPMPGSWSLLHHDWRRPSLRCQRRLKRLRLRSEVIQHPAHLRLRSRGVKPPLSPVICVFCVCLSMFRNGNCLHLLRPVCLNWCSIQRFVSL